MKQQTKNEENYKITEYIPGKPYKLKQQQKNEENYKIKSEPTKKTTNLNNPNIQNSRTKNNTNPRRTQKRK